MVSEYQLEEVSKLLASHMAEQGFKVETDRILTDEIPWRPPIYASRGNEQFAVDVRLNDKITDFWLETYLKTSAACPDLKIFVAIPDDIVVPYNLGKRLEGANVGIIVVSEDSVNYLLEPRTQVERETTKAIRKRHDAQIDRSQYEGLQPYVKEIFDAVNIFEIGCPREAIGAIGRVVETAVDDFLILANRKRKIPLSDSRRRSMTFDSKINFLASPRNQQRSKPRVITEGEKSKMLSVKWDRNIGDHPATEAEVDQLMRDSRAMLELGINMIRLISSKKQAL